MLPAFFNLKGLHIAWHVAKLLKFRDLLVLFLADKVYLRFFTSTVLMKFFPIAQAQLFVFHFVSGISKVSEQVSSFLFWQQGFSS